MPTRYGRAGWKGHAKRSKISPRGKEVDGGSGIGNGNGIGNGIGNERMERLSRSTIACNGCRVLKQKCGGEKPVCFRCRMLKRSCIWPQQLKRGPSTGYNESLEQRLRETESILLAVLDNFTGTTGQIPQIRVPDIHEDNVTPSAAEKKERLEEWTQFPLRTKEDVLRWRDERAKRATNDMGQNSEGMVDPSPEGDLGRAFSTDIVTGGNDINNLGRAIPRIGNVDMESLWRVPPDDHISAAELNNYNQPVQERGNSSANFHHNAGMEVETYTLPIQKHTAPTPRLPGSVRRTGVLGLSKDFQDTFLW